MLAFEKITDKDVLIARIYPDENSTKAIQDIYFVHKFEGDSEIVNDDIKILLREEQLIVMKDNNITLMEYERLCEDLKSTKPVNEDYPRSMKKAYLAMKELISFKLKRELVIARSDKEWIRPEWDTSNTSQVAHQFYCGASGSGKTVACTRAVLRNPFLYHVSKFIVIGTTGESDPSYEPLRKKMGPRFDYLNSEEITPEQCRIEFYPRHSIICFDDCGATVDRKRRRAVHELMERLLTTARHRHIQVISIHHRLNSYKETSMIRNSSSTWHIFGRTLPMSVLQVLEKNFGWKKRKREDMLKKCQFDGRMTVFRMDHPQALITSKRILLL